MTRLGSAASSAAGPGPGVRMCSSCPHVAHRHCHPPAAVRRQPRSAAPPAYVSSGRQVHVCCSPTPPGLGGVAPSSMAASWGRQEPSAPAWPGSTGDPCPAMLPPLLHHCQQRPAGRVGLSLPAAWEKPRGWARSLCRQPLDQLHSHRPRRHAGCGGQQHPWLLTGAAGSVLELRHPRGFAGLASATCMRFVWVYSSHLAPSHPSGTDR